MAQLPVKKKNNTSNTTPRRYHAIRLFFIHSFIHFICSTKIKTVALQTENEQDSEAHIYALTAALTNNIKMQLLIF